MSSLVKLSVLCILLLNILNIVFSARILAFIAIPSFSHQNAYRPLFNELSLRGHEVVFLTTDPVNNKTLKNLTEVNLHGVYDIFKDHRLLSDTFNLYERFKLFKYLDNLITVSNAVLDYELEHPEVQKILNNKNEKFDLVIGEFLIPEVMGFAFRFNCPFIGVDSMDAYLIPHEIMGNPTHGVLYPHTDLGFTENLSFFGRIKSVLLDFAMKHYVMYYLSPVSNERTQKYFKREKISKKEFYDKLTMLFVNANPVFCNTRPLVSGTINLGAAIHVVQPKELPKVGVKVNFNAKQQLVIKEFFVFSPFSVHSST